MLRPDFSLIFTIARHALQLELSRVTVTHVAYEQDAISDDGRKGWHVYMLNNRYYILLHQ